VIGFRRTPEGHWSGTLTKSRGRHQSNAIYTKITSINTCALKMQDMCPICARHESVRLGIKWVLSMLMVVISWNVHVGGVDILGCGRRWHIKPLLSSMYRYLGRYNNTSYLSYLGFDNWHFLNVLIIDGTDICTIVIMSMSMSQPITSMAPSTGNYDTIKYASMADP
jgi:hypothetical protein